MGIRIKVSDLLGKHKKTQKDLASACDIRANTVSALYHETVKTLNVQHLNSICKFFNCSIGEVLEYIPDDEQI